jgi:hypothetical protein
MELLDTPLGTLGRPHNLRIRHSTQSPRTVLLKPTSAMTEVSMLASKLWVGTVDIFTRLDSNCVVKYHTRVMAK